MLKPFADQLRGRKGRDTVLTTLTEALATLGMVLAFWLAARVGKEELDLYVIVRRTVAFVFPVVLMGAMVGLTRYVAMSPSPAVARRYLRGALAWALPLSVLLVLCCWAFAARIAWGVFGTETYAPLVVPTALMTVGIALHGVAYGYLRGSGAISVANALQLSVLALAPCLSFVLLDDLAAVLWWTGGLWVAAALLSILPACFGSTEGSFRREGAELLRYGLPRVPGDVALGALLTIPGYVALRTHGIDLSGEVAFGATLLNIAAAAFSPVALLLLPAAAARLAQGDHAGLAASIRRMMRLVFLASLALTVGFELLAVPVLRIYLGAETGDIYVPMARLVFLGALPFAFFNGMRSVLDAYFHTPRNGINLVSALIVLLLGSVVHLLVPTPWFTMGIVLVLSLTWLGFATWRDVRFVISELDRLAQREQNALSVMVVIPDEEEGSTYAASKAQARDLMRSGVKVTFFHLTDRRSPLGLWRSRRRLKKLLAERRPDVVHVHFGSVAALFTVLVSSVPVVVTFMGDDLDRRGVPGFARSRMGGLFSQVAAFFASGIICTDERLRSMLWWRTSDAVVLPLDGDGTLHTAETLAHLRSVGLRGQ